MKTELVIESPFLQSLCNHRYGAFRAAFDPHGGVFFLARGHLDSVAAIRVVAILVAQAENIGRIFGAPPMASAKLCINMNLHVTPSNLPIIA